MSSPAQATETILPEGITYDMICNVVGWIGTAIGIALNITPAVLFYNIMRGFKKINIIPESMLVFNIVCSMLWFCYWFKLNEFVPGFSAFVGAVLSVIFSLIYVYFFADGKILLWLFYSFIILDLVVQMFYITVYIIPQASTVGFIAMIINIINYAAPGQKIFEVIQKQNHDMIPIVTVIVATMCSVCWLTFGLLKNDINCIIPNSIGLVLSLINMIVWIIFYCKSKGKKEDKEKTEDLNDEDGEKAIN